MPYKEYFAKLRLRVESTRAPGDNQILTIEIPPLMECYLVMLFLGDPGHGILTRLRNEDYLGRIEEYFGPSSSHPLIAEVCREYPGNDVAGRIRAMENTHALYCYEGVNIGPLVSYPLSLQESLASKVSDFARDSGFMEFYENNAGYYDILKRIVRTNYSFGRNVIPFFNDNFEKRFDRFNVYFSPLIGNIQQGPGIDEDSYAECFYFGGCMYGTVKGRFYYPSWWMQFVILTEFDHSFINPLTARYRSDLEKLEGRFALLNREDTDNYSSLESTLNEYVTWAFALQYFYEHDPQHYGEYEKCVTASMERRKFARFAEFMKMYREYMDNRESYPGLGGFYPRIIEWVESLS
jgi:hypothetical protein